MMKNRIEFKMTFLKSKINERKSLKRRKNEK